MGRRKLCRTYCRPVRQTHTLIIKVGNVVHWQPDLHINTVKQGLTAPALSAGLFAKLPTVISLLKVSVLPEPCTAQMRQNSNTSYAFLFHSIPDYRTESQLKKGIIRSQSGESATLSSLVVLVTAATKLLFTMLDL